MPICTKEKPKDLHLEVLRNLEAIRADFLPKEERVTTQTLIWYPSYRSGSPVTSSSGHSSPSEVIDSGVCSEHDTPPPRARLPTKPRQQNSSSDSDNESSLSSDETEAVTQCRRRRVFQASVGAKGKMPRELLREIYEKSQEMQRRREAVRTASPHAGNLRKGRPKTLSSKASRQPLAHLQEEQPNRWVSAGAPESQSPLFECREENACSGFAGIRDIFSPRQESTIRSQKGTVRGVKNRVRAGIATFTSDQRILRHFMEQEKDRVVVYITTLGIVRETFERCLRIRKILWTLLVSFEERDVFMSRDTQIELLDRLGVKSVTVPHVFLEGQYLGGTEQIEKLNETGEIRKLFQRYRRPAAISPCNTCGGFRLLPCSMCNGSKKSVHRNNFTLEFIALKCSLCDESGLVKCEECPQGP